ncbi:15479_t:CDS:2, partial [Funneliformis caledonium]
PSQGYNRINYDPENLPMRSHTSHLQDIEAMENKGLRNKIQHERECAFSFSATKEELHSLFQEYNMTKAEVRKVKQYYATALDLTMNDVSLITEYIQKYGKLRTKSSVLIGSKLANRGGDVARNNYSIALLVDKNAHLSRAPVDFEEHEFYSQILYYFVYEYNNELSMLAFVQ